MEYGMLDRHRTDQALSAPRGRVRNDSEGFTLVEMMIAIVVLTLAVLGVAGSTGQMALKASTAEVKSKAVQAVEDRITRVAMDPRYPVLDSIYDGTEASMPDMPGFSRRS